MPTRALLTQSPEEVIRTGLGNFILKYRSKNIITVFHHDMRFGFECTLSGPIGRRYIGSQHTRSLPYLTKFEWKHDYQSDENNLPPCYVHGWNKNTSQRDFQEYLQLIKKIPVADVNTIREFYAEFSTFLQQHVNTSLFAEKSLKMGEQARIQGLIIELEDKKAEYQAYIDKLNDRIAKNNAQIDELKKKYP